MLRFNCSSYICAWLRLRFIKSSASFAISELCSAISSVTGSRIIASSTIASNAASSDTSSSPAAGSICANCSANDTSFCATSTLRDLSAGFLCGITISSCCASSLGFKEAKTTLAFGCAIFCFTASLVEAIICCNRVAGLSLFTRTTDVEASITLLLCVVSLRATSAFASTISFSACAALSAISSSPFSRFKTSFAAIANCNSSRSVDNSATWFSLASKTLWRSFTSSFKRDIAITWSCKDASFASKISFIVLALFKSFCRFCCVKTVSLCCNFKSALLLLIDASCNSRSVFSFCVCWYFAISASSRSGTSWNIVSRLSLAAICPLSASISPRASARFTLSITRSSSANCKDWFSEESFATTNCCSLYFFSLASSWLCTKANFCVIDCKTVSSTLVSESCAFIAIFSSSSAAIACLCKSFTWTDLSSFCCSSSTPPWPAAAKSTPCFSNNSCCSNKLSARKEATWAFKSSITWLSCALLCWASFRPVISERKAITSSWCLLWSLAMSSRSALKSTPDIFSRKEAFSFSISDIRALSVSLPSSDACLASASLSAAFSASKLETFPFAAFKSSCALALTSLLLRSVAFSWSNSSTRPCKSCTSDAACFCCTNCACNLSLSIFKALSCWSCSATISVCSAAFKRRFSARKASALRPPLIAASGALATLSGLASIFKIRDWRLLFSASKALIRVFKPSINWAFPDCSTCVGKAFTSSTSIASPAAGWISAGLVAFTRQELSFDCPASISAILNT